MKENKLQTARRLFTLRTQNTWVGVNKRGSAHSERHNGGFKIDNEWKCNYVVAVVTYDGKCNIDIQGCVLIAKIHFGNQTKYTEPTIG